MAFDLSNHTAYRKIELSGLDYTTGDDFRHTARIFKANKSNATWPWVVEIEYMNGDNAYELCNTYKMAIDAVEHIMKFGSTLATCGNYKLERER